MDLEVAIGHRRRERMEEHDRVSHASSVATISLPVRSKSDDKVQTFGKRCRAAKRDPNCPVVMRGWLFKRDSTGLRLWKRRWFVLSDYCLFYYKDSREESVLGSIPLPSYKVLFCTQRECKNRKHAFKVVHQGMRAYVLSADTQEDMLGWVRALSQSACMDTDGMINRRCSSYQDFTHLGGSSESVDLSHPPTIGDSTTHVSQSNRSQQEQHQFIGGRNGTPPPELRARRRVRLSPPVSRGRSLSLDREVEEPISFLSPQSTYGSAEYNGSGPPTPRGHQGPRPHTPVGRVDIRPQDSQSITPPSPSNSTHSAEKWHAQCKPIPAYCSAHHQPRRTLGKGPMGGHADQLPPLPPSRVHHAPHPHHYSHMPVSPPAQAVPMKPDMFRERELQPLRALESDTDTVLTRLCGCDKLLQTLCIELAHLQADKDSVQCALEMTHLQLNDWRLSQQDGIVTQKALLQDELVTVRARMCDVSLEMDRVWNEYERIESELSVCRSHLQHVCHFGMPQEQSQAQRQLWMMDDILCGLKVNRNHFQVMLGLQRPMAPPPLFQKPSLQSEMCAPQMDSLPTRTAMEEELEPPARPPLPQELQQTSQRRETVGGNAEDLTGFGHKQSSLPRERRYTRMNPDRECPVGGAPVQKGKGHLRERSGYQERLANKRRAPVGQDDRPHPCEEPTPVPLRVTRVVTAVLPSSLTAHRVAVEDPPRELVNSLPEQLDQPAGRAPNKPRRLFSEVSNPKLNRKQGEAASEMPDQKQEDHSIGSLTREDLFHEVARALPAEVRRSLRRSLTEIEARNQGLLNSDPDTEPTLTSEQREAKLRRVERIRERVIRSAVRESKTSAGHPIPVILVNEKKDGRFEETDFSAGGACNLGDRDASGGNGTSGPVLHGYDEGDLVEMDMMSHGKPLRKGRTMTYRKPPYSANHISKLTVFQSAVDQSASHNKEPRNRGINRDTDSLDYPASTNRRAEWFLSTTQRQDYIPLFPSGLEPDDSEQGEQKELHNSSPTGQKPDPLGTENQTNYVFNHLKVTEKLTSELSCGPTGVSEKRLVTEESGSTHITDILGPTSNEAPVITEHEFSEQTHPITEPGLSAMPCPSDQSEQELCIYEEIQCTDVSSKATNDNEENPTPTPTDQSENGQSLLPNQHGEWPGEGGGTGDVTETGQGHSEQETELDFTENDHTGQTVYSSVVKSAASNQYSFTRPRVTVVRTSL